MPSQKPRITVYTDYETNQKLAYIAKLENRSSSNYTECLIKNAISAYEKEYGTIPIETEKEDGNALKFVKAITGVTAGEALGDMAVDMIHKIKDSNAK